MLTIIEGTDFGLKQKAIEKIIGKIAPDAVLRFDVWSDKVVEHIESVDLFGEKRLIIIQNTTLENVSSHIEAVQKSQNFFIFVFEKLLAPEKKKFSSSEIVSCIEKVEKKEGFNMFSFTDALVARDKKNLWILYEKARRAGVSEQEIVNILIWQVKTMLLVAITSVSESGLKPFVYNKTKKSLEKYSISEVESLYTSLVSMYHNARRGSVLHTDLERKILSL